MELICVQECAVIHASGSSTLRAVEAGPVAASGPLSSCRIALTIRYLKLLLRQHRVRGALNLSRLRAFETECDLPFLQKETIVKPLLA